MSLKEMEASHDYLYQTDRKPVFKISRCEPTKFKNSTHAVRLFEVFQSLRKDEILCDVRLETNDGAIVFGHKIVLVSVSPYFHAKFCRLKNRKIYLVKIKKLHSIVLKLLVDYIYTGDIVITGENVQVLLLAANILQLDYVIGVCTEYLVTQMDISNCFGVKEFAEIHNCTELMTSTEGYIKKHFLDVVKGNEFLSLSSQQVINIISWNDIAVASEEKVFECVIKWVKFELECRTDFLPEIMKHVRLPLLVSTPEILKEVLDEPLLKNSPDFKDYTHELLQFNLLKSIQHFTIPETIRCKPRQSGGLQKVILTVNCPSKSKKCYIEWYEPTTKLRKKGPEMNVCRRAASLAIMKDQFVFAVGGVNNLSSKSVCMLDLSSRSPCWVPMVDMLVSRKWLGVGVIDDCLHAVGGFYGTKCLNSAEVFDVSTQKWRMICSMSMNRRNFGVGVVNNRLYVVGGHDGSISFKSVECYDPILDTWSFIKGMSATRAFAGVGVLNGIMYAVGGCNVSVLKSVEAFNPSTGVWSAIADMHLGRFYPGVVALDGLLYVIGGYGGSLDSLSSLDSIEMYNPSTNTWIMDLFSRNDVCCYSGVVVDRPFHFITN